MPFKIADGYTFKDEFPGRGPWPAVAYDYRPALYEETQEYLDEAVRGGKAKVEANLKLLLRHVVGWDVTDASDAPATVSEANLRRFPHVIIAHMVNAVTGYSETQQAADAKN